MLNGLYVVISQLIKSIGKATHLNLFFNILDRGKRNINATKKF